MLAEASRAKRRLSFEEVHEAGLPAVYQRYADRLLYLDGRIFNAGDPSAPAEIPLCVAGAAGSAVGVEFGGRHASGRSCHFCLEGPAS